MANTGFGGRRGELLSKVKKILENVPIVSNIVINVVLFCLEKMVETEFSCPCKNKLSAAVVLLYFVVPIPLTFILMWSLLELLIQCDKCGRENCSSPFCGDKVRGIFICSIPAIVWVSLLFLDGRYVACAATKWSGNYVTIDKNVNKKWCDPQNSTFELIETQRFFGISQVVGLTVVLFVTVGALIYKCKGSSLQPSGSQHEKSELLNGSVEMLHAKMQQVRAAAQQLAEAAQSTRAAAATATESTATAAAFAAFAAVAVAAADVLVAAPQSATRSDSLQPRSSGDPVSPHPSA